MAEYPAPPTMGDFSRVRVQLCYAGPTIYATHIPNPAFLYCLTRVHNASISRWVIVVIMVFNVYSGSS